MAHLGVSFHLLIEDQGLILSEILVPFDFHRFMFRAPWWFRPVKHLPAMWETPVRSLGGEDPLEKEMTIYSNTLSLHDALPILPGSSVHGILQARILEWVVISFSRGSSPPRHRDRKSTRLNSSHSGQSRMPSSA